MASPDVALEVRLDRIERTLGDLVAIISGGASTGGVVTYEKSIRGRLHEVENILQAADKLADAARDLRRSQGRRWSLRERAILSVCALVTAGCAVLTAVYAIFG